MQFPCPVVLFIASFFIPYSPRWLASKDRVQEAQEVLQNLHGDNDDGANLVQQEMSQIFTQIAMEKPAHSQRPFDGLRALMSRQYRFRVFLSCFVLTMCQLAGVNVIQSFQSIFYASVSFVGHTALLVSGVYGCVGIVGQLISLTLVAGMSNSFFQHA